MARTLVELAGLPTVPSCNGMDPEPSTHCLHGQSYASAFGVGSAPKRDFAIMQWPCELTPSRELATKCLILACARRRRLREPEAAGNEDAAGRQGDDGLRAAESPLALCASLPSPSGYVTRMGDKLTI